MRRHESGKRPVSGRPMQRGVLRPLDVRVSPTLQRRMADLGLPPIPDTVVAKDTSPLRLTLFDQPSATKIVQ
jgi:hypothetical protein